MDNTVPAGERQPAAPAHTPIEKHILPPTPEEAEPLSWVSAAELYVPRPKPEPPSATAAHDIEQAIAKLKEMGGYHE
jgi:hypothetical protein